MTIEVDIENKRVPAVKQACKEFGFDVIHGNVGEINTSLIIILSEPSQLLYVGIVAGINISHNGLKNELMQLKEAFQTHLDKFKK